MADAKDKQLEGAPFSNAETVVRAKYDFANDAGAIGDLTLVEAEDDLVILECYIKGIDAMTSGGAATIDIGFDGGSELLSAEGFASFGAGDLVQCSGLPLKMADGVKLDLGIVAAALTAGSCEIYVRYGRF